MSNLHNFIKANLTSSKFSKFPNLNINSMSVSDFWLDKEFTSNIKKVKSELHITNTNAPNVTFLPIVASTAPKSNCSTGNGNDIGKAILYPYSDFNGQQKYLIGIVYDSFSNLDADAILVSYSLLNNAINEHTGLLINNAKMSKFNENELRHYLTFINTKNNYYFDLTKILNPEYLATSNFTSSLSGIVAIGNEKLALESNVINMQLVIVFSQFVALFYHLLLWP